jgi:hypothetical protein
VAVWTLNDSEHKLQNLLVTYLPLLTSVISLFTAIAVAFIGLGFSRSMEAGKVRASYLNYALQKIMDEYLKYDPVIDLSKTESNDYVRLIEERFRECRASILRVSPLIPATALDRLQDIDMKYSGIIRRQHNAKLSGIEPELISADDYAQMLTDYINLGHRILKKQVESRCELLERGESRTARKS